MVLSGNRKNPRSLSRRQGWKGEVFIARRMLVYILDIILWTIKTFYTLIIIETFEKKNTRLNGFNVISRNKRFQINVSVTWTVERDMSTVSYCDYKNVICIHKTPSYVLTGDRVFVFSKILKYLNC